MVKETSGYIKNWQDFAREVRPGGCHLLRELRRFPNSVLVSGCQRSGTTLMVDIIKNSDEFDSSYAGKGAELKGALILAGLERTMSFKRNCFQVTYLNNCYHELLSSDVPYKLIWLIRNPYSVIYSLIHNWPSFALENLFIMCGQYSMTHSDRENYEKNGSSVVSKIKKACYSYNSKLEQLIEIYSQLGKERILGVNYDSLIKNKDDVLSTIYRFIGLPFKKEYGLQIHNSSLSKSSSLSEDEKKTIDIFCLVNYQKCKGIIETVL